MPQVTIDGVIYNTETFPPQAMQALNFLNKVKEDMNETQVKLTIQQAAYNNFGDQLRMVLKEIAPAPVPEIGTPPDAMLNQNRGVLRAAAKKAPARAAKKASTRKK